MDSAQSSNEEALLGTSQDHLPAGAEVPLRSMGTGNNGHASSSANGGVGNGVGGGVGGPRRVQPARTNQDGLSRGASFDHMGYAQLSGGQPSQAQAQSNERLSASFLKRVPRSQRAAIGQMNHVLNRPLNPGASATQQQSQRESGLTSRTSLPPSSHASRRSSVGGGAHFPLSLPSQQHHAQVVRLPGMPGAYARQAASAEQKSGSNGTAPASGPASYIDGSGVHVLHLPPLPNSGNVNTGPKQSLAELASEARHTLDMWERDREEQLDDIDEDAEAAGNAAPARQDPTAAATGDAGGGGWYGSGAGGGDGGVADSLIGGGELDLDGLVKDEWHLAPTKALVEAADERRVLEIFIEEMGTALFSCGLPVHVVEFYLTLVSARLKIPVQFQAINTTFWVTFGSSTVAHMIVVRSTALSLSKLVDTCAVSERILRGEITPVDGLAQLQAIMRRPARFTGWSVVPLMAVCCFLYAVLFSAGWAECLVAAVSGLAIGAMEQYAMRRPNIARGHDLLAGAIAAGLAMLTHSYIVHINLLAATFGGVVWCLPGLRITMAMLDLSTGHPVTASAKMLTTALTAINVGIGIVAGISLGKLTGYPDVDLLHMESYGQIGEWFTHVSVVTVCVPVMMLLDARPSHAPQYIMGACLAYYTSSICAEKVGQAFGAWLAAGAVGLFSNIYGRLTQWPAIELAMFSILMLVPGSIGVRSVLAQDSTSSAGFVSQMLTIAIAIVTGLFTANVILPPVRAL